MSSTETYVGPYVGPPKQGAELTMADPMENDGKSGPPERLQGAPYSYEPSETEVRENREAIGFELIEFDPLSVDPLELSFRCTGRPLPNRKQDPKFVHCPPIFVREFFRWIKMVEPNASLGSVPKRDRDSMSEDIQFINSVADIEIDNVNKAESFLKTFVQDLRHDPTTNALTGNVHVYSKFSLGWMKRRGNSPSILTGWLRANGVSLVHSHSMTTSVQSLAGYLFYGHPGNDCDPAFARKIDCLLASAAPNKEFRFTTVTGQLYHCQESCQLVQVYTKPNMKNALIDTLNKVPELGPIAGRVPTGGDLVFLSAPIWESMRIYAHKKTEDAKFKSMLPERDGDKDAVDKSSTAADVCDNPRSFYIAHQNKIMKDFRSIVIRSMCIGPHLRCANKEGLQDTKVQDYILNLQSGDGTKLFQRVIFDPDAHHIEFIVSNLHLLEANSWINVAVPEIARLLSFDDFETVFADSNGAHAAMKCHPTAWETLWSLNIFYLVSSTGLTPPT